MAATHYRKMLSLASRLALTGTMLHQITWVAVLPLEDKRGTAPSTRDAVSADTPSEFTQLSDAHHLRLSSVPLARAFEPHAATTPDCGTFVRPIYRFPAYPQLHLLLVASQASTADL